MAINYTDVFTTIGQYVAYENALRELAINLFAYRNEFAAQYTAHGVLITPYPTANDILDNIATAQRRCVNAVTNLLLDNQFLVPDLSLGNSYTLDLVLQRLYEEMIADDRYVSPLEIDTTVTEEIVNGQPASGSLFGATYELTTRAPGNLPLNDQLPRVPYGPFAGVTNDALTSHLSWARCINDAETGATLGLESFLIEPVGAGLPGFVRASGQGPSAIQVTTGPAKTFVPRSVGNFGTFTTSAPQGFTPHGCTITTDFDQSSSTTFAGVGNETTRYSLRCKGSSAVKVVLETSIPEAQLVRGQTMGLYVYAYTASGTNNFTLAVNERAQDDPGLSIDLASSTGAASTARFTRRLVTFNVPSYLIGPLYLRIEVPSANTGDVFFAEFGCAPYDYFGGCGLLILPGYHQTLVGDRASLDFAKGLDTGLGRFQEFFTNHYGFMLPTSGSTLIPDSLIQTFTITDGPTP